MSIHVGGRGPGHVARVQRHGGAGGVSGMKMGLNLSTLTYWTGAQLAVDLMGTQDGIRCHQTTAQNTTGNTTNGGYTISSIASMTGIAVGIGVSGTGIQAGTFVLSVGASSVTLNQPATATATGVALAFSFDGQQVPDAYRDSNGMPNALPPGVDWFQILLMPAVTSQQYKVTWQMSSGSIVTPAPGFFGGTASGIGTVSGNSITVTPAVLTPGSTPFTIFRWSIAGGGSYVTSLSCRPSVDSGAKIAPELITAIQALTASNGFIRPMQMTDAQHTKVSRQNYCNLAVADPGNDQSFTGLRFPTNANGQLIVPILTSANRNTLNTIDWGRRDKVPVELLILLANATNRNLILNLPLNADSTYHTAIANLIVNGNAGQGVPPLNAGLIPDLRVSNEVWNDGDYVDAWQVKNEASDLGITWAQHYAKLSVEVFKIYEPILTTAGRTAGTGFLRTLEWQQVSDPAIWDEMLNYSDVDAHVDKLSVGGYYSPTIDLNTSPTAAAVAAAIPAGVDSAFDHTAAHASKATARAKLFDVYEGGLDLNTSNSAYRETLDIAPELHDPQAYALQEAARRLGSSASFNYFVLTGINGLYGEWGLLDVLSTSIDSVARAKAIKDFVAGSRTLFDLTYGAASVAENDANGTALCAAPTGDILPGVVFSLFDNDGGRVAINPATGQPTLADHTLLTATGTRNFTVRQTLAAGVNSPHDQVVSYTVNPPLNNTHPYRYYRLSTTFSTAGTNGVGLAELAIAARPGGADTTAGRTYSASSSFSGLTPDLAFDGVISESSSWASDFSGTWPQWLKIDYGPTSANWIAANEIRISARNSNLQAPGNFIFQGSDDGTAWTDLITKTGETFTALQTKTYVV